MSGFSLTSWCFLAAVLSQLSAAPTPAPIEEYIQSSQSTMSSMTAQGQPYGNYAMNRAQANGQYAVDRMTANGEYAAGQMKASAQQGLDAGKNLVNRAQNSIGNISLNPLNYVPYWMKPDAQNLSNLAQTTADYAKYYAQKGNEMLQSAQETGSNLLQRGIENGQYYLGYANDKGQELSNTLSGKAQYGIGQGKEYTRGGIRQGASSIQTMGEYEKSYLGNLGMKLDTLNGYIAGKLYKTADGVGDLDIPSLNRQLYSY